MSGEASKDLSSPPVVSECAETNNSTKEGSSDDLNAGDSGKLDKNQKASAMSVSSVRTDSTNERANGEEVGAAEVEYIESESLQDVTEVDACLKTLLARLDSKDWVIACEALNNVRQLSIYQKERLSEILADVIPLVTKSLKCPRSAVCKTSIMTSADLFKSYGDLLIDSIDPLLTQLLLKASQDKRFVCEAAERALIAMTTCLSPSVLLPKLQPYLKNRNPRVRAKASICFSRSVPQLGVEGIREFGIDKLIQIAAAQLSDQLPESREAARMLALELQGIYRKWQSSQPKNSKELSDPDSWEVFCQSQLSPLSAQAILRITSVPKEGLVVGC